MIKKVAKLSQNGNLNVNGEIVEIPEELRSGRNLLKNSNFSDGLNNWSGVAGIVDINNKIYIHIKNDANINHGVVQQFLSFEKNTEYVISFTAYCEPGYEKMQRILLHQQGSDGNSPQVSLSYTLTTTPTEYTLKFKSVDSDLKTSFSFYLYNYGSTSNYYVTNIKFEKGSIATPYSPAPEDLNIELPNWVQSGQRPLSFQEEGIVTGEIVEIPEELRGTGGRNLLINSSIERIGGNEFLAYADVAPIFDKYGVRKYTISFDIKSPVSGGVQVYMQNGSGARYSFTTSVSVASTYTRQSVTVTPSIANLNLTQSFLSFYGVYGTGRFITVRNVKIELEPTRASWSHAPEDLGHEIPMTIQDFGHPQGLVGGRNLLRDSGVRIISNVYNIKDYILTETLAENTELTISLKGQLGVGKTYFGIYNSGGATSPTTLYPSDRATDGIYRKTFLWKTGTTTNTFLRVYHMVSTTIADSEIEWIKLEKGKKSTPWTPSPEDLGLNYSSDIQNFKSLGLSMNEKGLSLSGEYSEVPDALTFNGTNGFISFPKSVEEQLHGITEATVEFWCKKLTVVNNYGFMQLSGFANTNGNIYPYTNPKMIYIDIFRTDRIGPINLPINTSEMHHFACTSKPGTNGWCIYQNGELIYSGNGPSTISTNYGGFTIGKNSNSRFAHALFKDVKLWNVSRTQEEIKSSMQNSFLRNEANLIGHWKLDDGYGDTVKDYSPNANHGTIIGGAEWVYSMNEEGGI